MTGSAWVVLAACAATVAAAMALTALAARRAGRWSVVDVTWGAGFVAVAVVAAVVGDGNLWRRLVFVLLVGVWGLRLASHILRRGRGHGEDPRYEVIKSEGKGGIVRRVLAPQGATLWFISLPVQVAAVSGRSLSWLAALGILVWAVGLAFEAVGDAQLAAFRADPAARGTVMDRGLWGWTRHPNYFGDACLWWGLWLIAADSGWLGAIMVLSPVAMTFFIRNVTGAKLLERTMMERPGYPAYAERVPMFFPRPPRKP